MNNFKTTIGIEVHIVVTSKTKMFSSSRSSHDEKPNTLINEIDLGLPGTLPSVNKMVVEKAIVLAKHLNMKISKLIRFDRKNYFYQDLPKGYQITQQFYPIGKDGYIDIILNDGTLKRIEIERIHIEEDTAKQIKQDDNIFLDFNRAGMPLIELVTKPCINSGQEAEAFLKQLRKILQFNNISDAKMESGSMRADINVSIAPIGSSILGVRSEIKNINSINNVSKAITYEEIRKEQLIVSNEKDIIDTRRFDDKENKTIFMREKTTNIDYRYMTEPNILEIRIDNNFIDESLKKYYIDFKAIKEQMLKECNDEKIVDHILNDYNSYLIFKNVYDSTNDFIESYKWIFIEYLGIATKENMSINDIKNVEIRNIIKMIQYLKEEKINGKQAKVLIKEFFNKDINVEELIEQLGFKQINDPSEIEKIMMKYIDNEIINELNTRPEKVEKFFIGKVMKETNGQANPNISKQVYTKIVEILKK